MAVINDTTEQTTETTVSFPILKQEVTPEGDILVYGKATDGTVDSDQQIVDPTWSAKAIGDWLESGGNLRVQHNPHRDPAGIGVQIDVDRDGDGSHWLKALVVEPTAKRLVEKKALRAFSVGIMRPRIVTDKHARGGRIVDGELGEISLVDRPANRNCAFTLVKADKSGEPEYVGDTGEVWGAPLPTPQVIAKMLNGNGVAKGAVEPGPERPAVEQGEVPVQGSQFASPVSARLAAALAAEKRDFSQAERDTAADSGAAMPDGSFPVKTREDLHNAIHLAGHAKDPDAARAHIKRRASSIGHSEDIPDSWKGEESELDKGKDCKTCGGSGKIMEGNRDCPDCGPGDTNKGKGTFGNNSAQAQSGAKYPDPNKDSDPDNNTGDDDDDDKDDRSEGGSGSENGMKVSKGKFCPACGAKGKMKHSFCPNCGGKMAQPDMGKGRVTAPPAVPTDHAVGKDPAKPVPPHREPDGPQNEIFEEDADLTDGDEKEEGDSEPTPTWGARKTTAPYAFMRTHDALCAAYDADAVRAEYPSLKYLSDSVDARAWEVSAQQLVAMGDFAAGEKALSGARAAVIIMEADRLMAEDARAEMHKAFMDAYPNVHLSPGQISPSQLQRPYITAGHQHESAAAHGADPSVSLPPAAPAASSFQRGPLTAGHEAPSPGDSGQGMAAAKTPEMGGGMNPPGRTFYRNSSRDSTREAMQTVHDHITSMFPDLCPMTGAGGSAPKAAPAARPVAPVEKVRKAKKVVNKAVAPAPEVDVAEIVKSAARQAAEATYATAREELESVLDEYKTTITKQLGEVTAQVNLLGGQPDPASAPIRSAAVLSSPPNTGGARPVERRSMADEAASKMREEKLKFLQGLAVSGDPVVRGQAEAQIKKMLTA